ncbi:hypothetical protein FQN60_009876 [Etheostoma spectabile]|uniref:G-protein coupled receptors family 1 profile domain-containing protein n=1 Tax=Etheostoma spectabile TaxID=54343 RepID=A0A5J5DA70_9PERO|nr:hypothetical protein FQN60_009876 [Etheostoma spectabile]
MPIRGAIVSLPVAVRAALVHGASRLAHSPLRPGEQARRTGCGPIPRGGTERRFHDFFVLVRSSLTRDSWRPRAKTHLGEEVWSFSSDSCAAAASRTSGTRDVLPNAARLGVLHLQLALPSSSRHVVGFLLPLLANLVCSLLVLRTLRRPMTVGHGCDSKKRVLRMILVHLGIFIICFVPYNSILFLYALVRTQALANCAVERFARTLYPITLCMACLNCCLDPVVYYFTSESFQKSLTMGGKGSGSRPESIPRSDTETQDTENTLPRDTHTLASNGKDSKVSESQF